MKEDLNEKLLSAVRTKNIEEVRRCLEKGADVNYRNKFKDNSAFYAAVYPDHNILKLFLKRGLDVNMAYEKNKNLLHVAVENNAEEQGQLDVIALLVENGVNINLRDKYGNDPLGYACVYYWRNLKTIELLLKNGADMHSKNNYGISSYMMAKEHEMTDLLSLLDKYNIK